MATKPGFLTEWPWQRLGNFKYLVVAPWVANSLLEAAVARVRGEPVDLSHLLIFPFLLLRMIHSQIWISISRFQTARSKHRIVDRGIEFEQVDRERNWDDQIIFNGLIFYIVRMLMPMAKHLPLWRTDGAIVTSLLHAGPVEFLYYWFHRALHHHFLYSRYHSHHHSSIATEPITSVIHPFAEHIVYFMLFAIPLLTTFVTGTASIISFSVYISYVDFMNYMGHCNFELVPMSLFHVFPPLKYLMYTPSFHSLHHTQFRTNYSLFMPFYDYIYNTMDKYSDDLYEKSFEGKDETTDAVHLTHLTTLQSIYYLRLGFASLASKPYSSKWYTLMMWPLSWVSMMLTSTYGSSFTVERNAMKNHKMQIWAIPRYNFHYHNSLERDAINGLIEKSILEAEKRGAKAISLGLLNQEDELNRGGELYLRKYPNLKVKITDGSSLATAIVLDRIPAGTKQVVMRGKLSKIAYATVKVLCGKGIQVIVARKHECQMLKPRLPESTRSLLTVSSYSSSQVWLVGDGFEDEDQIKAPKSTVFIPFSRFPVKKLRKDCTYYSTPAMRIPRELENMHACENWLPRRVMSAWRVAGIVHALEGWDAHECGAKMFDVNEVWNATLRHGFVPFNESS